jgi:hypothetical protein
MRSYKVGYGKPPEHSKFKKGQSGNPSGRPKAKTHANFAIGYEQMKALAVTEAYRLISAMEGGRETKIPMIQAIIRGILVSAAKGSSRAQRQAIDLLKSIEEEHGRVRLERDRGLLDLKAKGEAELQRRKLQNVKGPDLIPHPDDIVINRGTYAVEIIGPTTEGEAELWDFIDDTVDTIATLEAEPLEERKTPGHKKMVAFEKKLLRKLLEALPDYQQRPSRRNRRG